MSTDHDIKAATMRVEDKIRRRPSIGRLTKSCTARVSDGLTCSIQDQGWTLMADMKRNLGGNDAAPDPSVYGRAAISSCLAIGYAHWFARLDVPLNSVEVALETDFDYGAVLGISEASPAYTGIRYSVHVDSPASESDVIRALDTADAHSPWLANMRSEVAVERVVQQTTLAA
ncbi:MAG: OsmC family protein [Alphaproteobacteria bacterium]|jgi:uncharacterized OsmC-like protein|nr:OsmC family protein [Alphaproteobacteria bacterium]